MRVRSDKKIHEFRICCRRSRHARVQQRQDRRICGKTFSVIIRIGTVSRPSLQGCSLEHRVDFGDMVCSCKFLPEFHDVSAAVLMSAGLYFAVQDWFAASCGFLHRLTHDLKKSCCSIWSGHMIWLSNQKDLVG